MSDATLLDTSASLKAAFQRRIVSWEWHDGSTSSIPCAEKHERGAEPPAPGVTDGNARRSFVLHSQSAEHWWDTRARQAQCLGDDTTTAPADLGTDSVLTATMPGGADQCTPPQQPTHDGSGDVVEDVDHVSPSRQQSQLEAHNPWCTTGPMPQGAGYDPARLVVRVVGTEMFTFDSRGPRYLENG